VSHHSRADILGSRSSRRWRRMLLKSVKGLPLQELRACLPSKSILRASLDACAFWAFHERCDDPLKLNFCTVEKLPGSAGTGPENLIPKLRTGRALIVSEVQTSISFNAARLCRSPNEACTFPGRRVTVRSVGSSLSLSRTRAYMSQHA
jgi:hypothetical protein